MSLPYPSVTFTPGTQLPDTDLDKLVADIEALSDGSGLDTNSIVTSLIEDASIGFDQLDDDAKWWHELGRQELSSPAARLTVNFTPKNFLLLKMIIIPSGGTANSRISFNNDTTTKYAQRYSNNGAADTTNAGVSTVYIDTAGAVSTIFAGYAYVMNFQSKEKITICHMTGGSTTGAATAPVRREYVHKWANTTDQINRVDLWPDGGTGQFGVGSRLVVLGCD